MSNRFEVLSKDELKGETIRRPDGTTFIPTYGEAIVLRDKQTGVLYLWCKHFSFNSGAGGLTPLLDQDGKPATMNYSVSI